jgi:hypothetical protein
MAKSIKEYFFPLQDEQYGKPRAILPFFRLSGSDRGHIIHMFPLTTAGKENGSKNRTSGTADLRTAE